MSVMAVRFFTTENVPVAEQIGAVTFWARDADLEVAEQRALAGLAERATAAGGDTVIGLRIETEQELFVRSEPGALGSIVLIGSEATYRIFVSGTCVRA